MDDKWIEEAFKKAQEGGGPDFVRDVLDRFEKKFPAMLSAFSMSEGMLSTERVLDAIQNDERVFKFIVMVFSCGMIEGKR